MSMHMIKGIYAPSSKKRKAKKLDMAKERPVYTGSYIIGIATMHKSNAVPVGRGDDPKHYAQMRR